MDQSPLPPLRLMVMPKATNKKRRTSGDIVSIPLGDGGIAFARVLKEPLVAFYDLRASAVPPIEDILRSCVAFKVFVVNYAITNGMWPVIGNAPLEDALREEPLFFKRDKLSGKLSIYKDSTAQEWPATRAECEGLECAAVWDPHHIVDRLIDHFAGRPNKWVESLRPK